MHILCSWGDSMTASLPAEFDGAPRDVQDAATICAASNAIGLTPPRDLLQFVQRWLARQQQQNRYGK